MKPYRVSRREFFDLIWSAPMRSVAADLGFSDVALKKAALKAGLPTPPQGHWNRVLAGRKATTKPILPPRGFGAPDQVFLGTDQWHHWNDCYKVEDVPPPAPIFAESIEEVRKRAQKLVGKLAAPRDLKTTHPAFRRILADEAARAEKARTDSYVFPWNTPRFGAAIDQRRLRLLNAICLGVENAGLKVSLSSKDEPVFTISGGASSLPLIVQKVSKKAKNPEKDNRLSIVVGTTSRHGGVALRQWEDVDGRKLEAIITEITVDIMVMIEECYREEQMRRHEWRLQDREKRIEEARQEKIAVERRERERREQLEQARIDRLLTDAGQLQTAQLIRQYVADVANHLASAPALPTGAFEKWRDWAHAQADRIDPVKNGSFLERVEDGEEA